MKYHFIVLVLLMVSLNANSSIDSAPHVVARQIEKTLNKMQNVFNNSEAVTAPTLYQGSSETAYYLKRIRLQLTAFAAFDISIFKLKVTPILEFRWTRKNPKGWVNYKKAK